MLYLSHEPTNAIYETGCMYGDHFFLMVYKNKRHMRLSQLQVTPYFPEFDEIQNAKLAILYSFLYSEYCKIISPERDYLYRSSIAIYERFFLDQFIDGFCHPSIKSDYTRGFNICFSADKAEQNLEFQGLMVCKLVSPQENSEFGVERYYDGFLEEDGSFAFFEVGYLLKPKKNLVTSPLEGVVVFRLHHLIIITLYRPGTRRRFM